MFQTFMAVLYKFIFIIFRCILNDLTHDVSLILRGGLTFREELGDFNDRISFTYYISDGNKYLLLLNQLKMCLF